MGRQAANFDEWQEALEHLVEVAKQNQYDEVLREGEVVRRMYPEYIGDANAYEFVAVADLAKGDKKAAVAVLTDYEKMGGEDPVDT